MNPEKGSLGQIAESLKALGIGGITEALVEEVADNCRRLPSEEFFYRTTSLLSLLGSGTTDFSTLKWSPSTNGVYAFDAEVSGLDEMYTNFLRGISALNEEELAFQNIQEDLSGVDQRSGAGMRRVSFNWNEASHSLEVEEQGDWFNMQFARDLGQIIQKSGTGKRLYYTPDGYQLCIFFYRSTECASSFQMELVFRLSVL